MCFDLDVCSPVEVIGGGEPCAVISYSMPHMFAILTLGDPIMLIIGCSTSIFKHFFCSFFFLYRVAYLLHTSKPYSMISVCVCVCLPCQFNSTRAIANNIHYTR